MSHFAIATFALLLAAPEPTGAEKPAGTVAAVRLRWNTVIENDRYCSPNGRFCLVMGQFENVPDLGGTRADLVVQFPFLRTSMVAGPDWVYTSPKRGHYASGPAFPANTATLYDGKRRIARIKLDFRWRGGGVSIADSGRYVVLVLDGPYNQELQPVVAVFGSDGSLRRSFLPKDLFSPGELAKWKRYLRLVPSLREDDESGRDLLLLTTTQWPEAIRIDLATGARLAGY